MIKPQDIIVALFLCQNAPSLSFAEKAQALGMSASEVHNKCIYSVSQKLQK